MDDIQYESLKTLLFICDANGIIEGFKEAGVETRARAAQLLQAMELGNRADVLSSRSFGSFSPNGTISCLRKVLNYFENFEKNNNTNSQNLQELQPKYKKDTFVEVSNGSSFHVAKIIDVPKNTDPEYYYEVLYDNNLEKATQKVQESQIIKRSNHTMFKFEQIAILDNIISSSFKNSRENAFLSHIRVSILNDIQKENNDSIVNSHKEIITAYETLFTNLSNHILKSYIEFNQPLVAGCDYKLSIALYNIVIDFYTNLQTPKLYKLTITTETEINNYSGDLSRIVEILQPIIKNLSKYTATTVKAPDYVNSVIQSLLQSADKKHYEKAITYISFFGITDDMNSRYADLLKFANCTLTELFALKSITLPKSLLSAIPEGLLDLVKLERIIFE